MSHEGARVAAYVGLGSNLEEPIAQVRAGIAALAALPDTRNLRCSSLYVSAPVGVGRQPDYINAVCRIETALDPGSLMQRLLEIEKSHGRRRGPERGAPRTLDLDLLLYGERVIHERDLTVPHPRVRERAFVLVPLSELDPTLVVPEQGSVASLLSACAGQRVLRLES